MNFAMTDVYGGVWGTTELSIPDANDQKALVDDQKTASAVSETGKKRVPIALVLVAVIGVVILAGVVK